MLPKSSSLPRSLAFLPGATPDTSGSLVLGQPFLMTVRSPFEPGLAYVTALALSTKPGIKLPDSRVFALNFDPLFVLSLDFPGFIGPLDAKGEARVTLWLPYLPWLKGIRIYAAALTADPQHATIVRQMTASVGWVL